MRSDPYPALALVEVGPLARVGDSVSGSAGSRRLSLASGGLDVRWGLVAVALALVAVGVGLALFLMADVLVMVLGAAVVMALLAMFRRVGDP